MYQLAIDDNAGGGHDAVAHDGLNVFDFFKLYRHTLFGGDVFDQLQRGLAVGAAGAEDFDIHV